MPHGLPRKVRRKATEMGAHADCIAAGPASCCHGCHDVIGRAFHFFYSDVHTGLIDIAITCDLQFDRLDLEPGMLR